MKISYNSEPLEKIKTECLAIGLFEEEPLLAEARKLDLAIGNQITSLLKSKDFKAEPNEIYLLPTSNKVPARRILLIGLGKKNEFEIDTARQAAATAVHELRAKKITAFSSALFGAGIKGPTSELAKAIAEGAILGNYAFQTYQTEEKRKTKPVESLELIYKDKSEISRFRDVVEDAAKVAEIVNYCRETANQPANIATPSYIAGEAEKLGRKYNFKVTVYDKKGIEKLGFNAILAVSAGSTQEPRFVVAEYKPKSASSGPVCLVGKTITFDSGGLDLKGEKYMENMKFDKCGGITVLGAIAAAAATESSAHLIGLIPISENLPSGSAYKVGDIYKTFSGTTIEIANTDAEGRVLMSDAIAYTKEFRPKAVIDLATLTGACVVALGNQAAGLHGNDKKLIDRVKAASEATSERVWELPMWKEYGEQIKSEVADIKNLGEEGAGTITAAKFLEKFVPKDTAWAHLDIAGVAYTEKNPTKTYISKGSTGYGIRLLTELFKNWR